MKIKSGVSAITALLLIIAFLAALFIFLSFTFPPAFFEILDHYLHIGSEKQAGEKAVEETLSIVQSGPAIEVPWEHDPKFLSQSRNYPVLMAAYKTVLIDPKPGEKANVSLAAARLAGKVIQEGEVFSQNGCLGPYTKENGFQMGPSLSGDNVMDTYGGGVCKIASTLYNVAVLCNLKVIERHCHSKPVPYVPYGQDATVSYGLFDFKFKNNTAFPILIWAELVDKNLFIAFYGCEKPPSAEWRHTFMKVFRAPKVYVNNPGLREGEERLVEEGMDGAIVQSTVTIRRPDGKIEIKQMGRSYYDPYPFIYEKKLF